MQNKDMQRIIRVIAFLCLFVEGCLIEPLKRLAYDPGSKHTRGARGG